MSSLLETLPIEYRQFRESVIKLANLVVQVRLFPSTHPSCCKALSEAFMLLDSMLKKRRRIVLSLGNHSFYHLNFELNTSEPHEKALNILYNLLSNMSINEMEFVSGLTKDELETFAKIISESSKKRADRLAGELLNMMHIKLRDKKELYTENPGKRVVGPERDRVKNDGRRAKAVGASAAITEEVSRVLDKLNKLESSGGRAAAGRLLNIVEGDLDASVVLLLNSLKSFDEYTFVHSINVAVISAALANAAGFGEDEVNRVAVAGLMHDIGKIYVPKQVIHKTSRLNPMEWALMKRHPVDGERILREEGVDDFACRVAYEHHMRFDLTGYPRAREGREMLAASHLIRIADTYDAITTRRPYRRQLSPYEAVKFMSGFSGTEFHPWYFSIFMRMLGNIPIGTVVKLNTGEEAVVVNVRRDTKGRILPSIRILKDPDGSPVKEEMVVDLGESTDDRNGRKIIAVVDDPVRDVDIGLYIG